VKSTLEHEFKIGDWLVQPQLNRLSRSDVTHQIEPKIMQVLLVLAESPGNVVSRKALLDTVWEGTIVSDEVVSRSISELRKAFGDRAREARYIETISRGGYRLIADIDFRHAMGDSIPLPELDLPDSLRSHVTAPASARPFPWKYLAVGFVLIMAVALGYVLDGKLGSENMPVTITSVPATTFLGFEIHPSLSPDGDRIAFIWGGPESGALDVYVKTITSDIPLRLTDDAVYEYSPTWSPDGSQIIFARSGKGLFSVPALGGPLIKVADIGNSSVPDITWSPDGESLVFSNRSGRDAPYRLLRQQISSGQTEFLSAPVQTSYGDTDPAYSPDGDELAFIRTRALVSDIYLVSEGQSEPRRVTYLESPMAGLDWMDDGEHIIFSAQVRGRFGLWRVSINNGDVVPVLLGNNDLRDPSLRGNDLAYTSSFVDANILETGFMENTGAGQEVADSPTNSVASSTLWDSALQYSPDGSRAAFVSSRSGQYEIWVSNSDGSLAQQITHLEAVRLGTPRWSPDGDQLLLSASLKGGQHLFLLNAAGGAPQKITDDDFDHTSPTWSRDGKNVYFSSNHSGSWQIWRMDLESKIEDQITQSGGALAFECESADCIYLSRRDQSGLWRVDLDSGESEMIHSELSAFDWALWEAIGDQIYYVERARPNNRLLRLNAESGETQLVALFPDPPHGGEAPISIAPSNDRVAYTRIVESRHDIMFGSLIR